MVAQHGHLLGDEHGIHVLAVEVGQLFAVGRQRDVTVHKASLVGAVAEFHTLGSVGEVDELLALSIDDARIDDYRQQEVEQHTAQHDQQALPCGLTAELVGLGGLFHGLGVHRLVDHARDGAVAAQGQPADAILGGSPRFLVLIGVIISCHGHLVAV